MEWDDAVSAGTVVTFTCSSGDKLHSLVRGKAHRELNIIVLTSVW